MRIALAVLCLLCLGHAQAGTMGTMGIGAAGAGGPATLYNPIIISPATLPITGSTTQYLHLSSGDIVGNTNTSQTVAAHPQALAGTLSGLTMTLVDASGAAATPTNAISATVFLNGSSTGYVCTITGTTSCSCPVSATCGASPVAVSPGDTISIALTTTGWTTTQLYASAAIVKANAAGEAEWFSSTGSVNIGATTLYFGANSNQSVGTESTSSMVMPVAGMVTGYTVLWSQTPTGSVFVTAQLCHNGTCSDPCAGWNGTSAVNPCSVTLTQSFSANDTYSIQMVPTGTNNTAQKTAISYTPTAPGQVILGTQAIAGMASTNPYSMTLRGFTTPMVSTATPSQTFGALPTNGAGIVFSQLTAFEALTVPTRSWTFQEGPITSGAPTATAMTCTNSASSTTIGGSLNWFGCTDAVHTISVASGAAQAWANWNSVGPVTNTGQTKISGVAVLTLGSAPPSTVFFPPLDMLSPVVGGLN